MKIVILNIYMYFSENWQQSIKKKWFVGVVFSGHGHGIAAGECLLVLQNPQNGETQAVEEGFCKEETLNFQTVKQQ